MEHSSRVIGMTKYEVRDTVADYKAANQLRMITRKAHFASSQGNHAYDQQTCEVPSM